MHFLDSKKLAGIDLMKAINFLENVIHAIQPQDDYNDFWIFAR
jgi:hypothetical protein